MGIVDHTYKEERLERMLRRLGGRNPSCGVCCENDPRCLELHHVAGRGFADGLVCLCRNCHRKLSDEQTDHPDSKSGLDKSTLTQIRNRLGRADLLRALAEHDEAEAIEIFEQALETKEIQK